MKLELVPTEELHQMLARLKQELETSVAAGAPYGALNVLYNEFIEVRNERNRRLRTDASGDANN
ncbi:hypothetical protein [Flaviaesturariibacter aridisoli]|uniref:Uncharacterized protein n=1 Tax=Flaviaesturariibacter aridisoli TaxID=2545761 RepID=A0A4R4DX88_9BACT|nr:hypothetical protein [Flaviaesturariibacter aridisoli]TCZ67709.1 hypothetical protein E0486_15220 [Flaviaesturariibacter aridisoli]